MVGDSGTSKNGNTYYYYTCKGHRAHKCSKMRVQQDWIEQLDVQLTKDNQLAVFHDYDLSMRTNGTGAFSDWNMADLKNWILAMAIQPIMDRPTHFAAKELA